MKIIDLINKKANREEVPKKIKYLESVWEWSELYFDYRSDKKNSTINDELLFRGIFNYPKERLNDGVEIIEEDKEIRKLPPYKYESEVLKLDLAKKIDELIDELNELKKGK